MTGNRRFIGSYTNPGRKEIINTSSHLGQQLLPGKYFHLLVNIHAVFHLAKTVTGTLWLKIAAMDVTSTLALNFISSLA